MSNYRSQADASQRSHANRIISSAGGGSHSTPNGEAASVKRKGYKNGGRCYEDGGIVEEMMEGETSAPRLDRPSRGKKGGATTVNVIIAQKEPQGAAGALPPMPPVPPMAPPAPPMPPMGAGGPPMPPEMPMRKNGGRVNTDSGAGSGLGRLEKIKDYGKKAGKPAKTPRND